MENNSNIDKPLLPNTLSSLYPNDGSPEYDCFYNKKGLKIYSYKWKVKNPKAIIIAIHGIQSHCRFEYLHHLFLSQVDNKKTSQVQLCTYEGSWVEHFNQNQITFTGIDLQGHGFSDSWNKSRCNVESFDDFGDEIILFIKDLIRNKSLLITTNNQEDVTNQSSMPPIYLMGISLGGCVVLRTIELLNSYNSNVINESFTECYEKSEKDNLLQYITGCIMLSPMLSLENAKKQLAGRIFLGIAGFMSRNFPNLRIANVGKNELYPEIDIARIEDSLVNFPSRIPAKMSFEILTGLDKTFQSSEIIPKNLRILMVHSINDTQCEIEGTEKFFNKIQNIDKEFWKLSSFWHCLTHEKGNEKLVNDIITWITMPMNQNVTFHTARL